MPTWRTTSRPSSTATCIPGRCASAAASRSCRSHSPWRWRCCALRDLPATARPLRAALWSSMVLFAAGGVIGLFIGGSNVTIPAHYHGCIVGVTLALMGLVFHLLPRLGYARAAGPAGGGAADRCTASGQLMHIVGLVWSGGYGVQRKVAGAEQVLRSAGEVAGMGLMGLGGLLAIVGGLLVRGVVLARDASRADDAARCPARCCARASCTPRRCSTAPSATSSIRCTTSARSTFFLFWIVGATGLYLYAFFDTSVAGAYRSVQALTARPVVRRRHPAQRAPLRLGRDGADDDGARAALLRLRPPARLPLVLVGHRRGADLADLRRRRQRLHAALGPAGAVRHPGQLRVAGLAARLRRHADPQLHLPRPASATGCSRCSSSSTSACRCWRCC